MCATGRPSLRGGFPLDVAGPPPRARPVLSLSASHSERRVRPDGYEYWRKAAGFMLYELLPRRTSFTLMPAATPTSILPTRAMPPFPLIPRLNSIS